MEIKPVNRAEFTLPLSFNKSNDQNPPFFQLDESSSLSHLQKLTNLLLLLLHHHQKPTISSVLQIQAQLITTGLLSSDPSCILSLLNLSLSTPSTLHLAAPIFTFARTQPPNRLTWPVMLRALGLRADPLKVFSLFSAVQRVIPNDPFVYASLLKGCARLSALREGKSVHCRVLRIGLDWNVNLVNSLISLYSCSRCLIGYARVLFDGMSDKSVVTVNCMVSGLVKNKLFDDGLGLFKRALAGVFGGAVKPNYVTLVVLVSGCVEVGRFGVGKSLHCYCCKTGLGFAVEVCNALIDLYSKFACTDESSVLFDEMPERDLVSWNTMISSCALNGNCTGAFSLFKEMRARDVGFDRVSLISLILAASSDVDLHMLKMAHGFIKASGIEITLQIGTALINIYAKCGFIDSARKIFTEIDDGHIASWNSMIHAYVGCGHDNEALELFNQIKSRNLKPDEATMLGLILACRNSRELNHGVDIHSYIESCSHLNQSSILHNALIDMYAKCGDMTQAKVVFDKMPKKDVVSWTSIIVGHAVNGQGEEALVAFRRMEVEKVEPNSITFLGLLSACDHAGLVEEGKRFYDAMCKFYHIRPRIEHYGCVVDMHARSGRLEEAHKLVKSMPVEPNSVIWRMLVSACKVHSNYDMGSNLIGELTERKALYSAENNVVSSNFYAETGRWGDVLNERSFMAACKATKIAGKSSISNLSE